MKERDEIEQLFSDAFSNEKVVVPPSIKAGIDKRIGSKGLVWWKFAVVTVVVGAVGFGIWTAMDSLSQNEIASLNDVNSNATDQQKKEGSNESQNTNSSNQSNFSSDLSDQTDSEKSAESKLDGSTEFDEETFNDTKNKDGKTSGDTQISIISNGGSGNSVINQSSANKGKSRNKSNSGSKRGNSGSLTRQKVTSNNSGDGSAGQSLRNFSFLDGGEGSLASDDGLDFGTGTRSSNGTMNSVNVAGNDSDSQDFSGERIIIVENERNTSSRNFKKDDLMKENSGRKVYLDDLKPSESRLKFKTPALFTDHLTNDLKNYVAQTTEPIKIRNKKSANFSWELGIYSGIYNSYNKSSKVNSLRNTWNSQIGFETSLQAKMRFKPRLAVGLGVGYGQNKLNISEESSTFTIDSIPGGMQIDSITMDTTFFPSSVDTTYSSTSTDGQYSLSKISIPLYFEYRQPLFKTFYLDVALGARFNIQSWKSENSPLSPTLSTFNMDVMLRPQFTYEVRKFSVGIYGRLDYTPFGLSSWNDLRANSIRGGLGINLSYRF